MAADSLVARHRAMPEGGWAWRSSIQAPHYQTDRDVGAASIGEGLLAAYAVTDDAALQARRRRRRATTCWASPSRPPAACAGPTGRIRAASGRRRTSRASTTARPGSATTSGGCSGRRASGASGRGRWRACAGWSRRPKARHARRVVVLVAVDRRSVLARRLQRRRHGPGGHRPRARRVRRPHRRSDLPRLRACRRRAASRAHRAMARARCRAAPRTTPPRPGSSPAPPERRTCSSSATRAIEIPPISRPRAGCCDWVNDQAVADALGRAVAGRSRASSAAIAGRIRARGLRASRGSTCGRSGATGDARVPRRRPPGGGLAAVRRDRRIGMGRAAGDATVSGPCRARQRRGRDRLGARRTSLARASTRPQTGRPLGRRSRRLRAGARRDRHGAFWYENRTGGRPRLRAEPSWHWGAAGSPPSPRASPAGPAAVRAGCPLAETVARATRAGEPRSPTQEVYARTRG